MEILEGVMRLSLLPHPADNTHLNLHNSSDDTQLHSIIVNYLQTKGCCIQKRCNKSSFVIKYWSFSVLESRRELDWVNFHKDFWHCYLGQEEKLANTCSWRVFPVVISETDVGHISAAEHSLLDSEVPIRYIVLSVTVWWIPILFDLISLIMFYYTVTGNYTYCLLILKRLRQFQAKYIVTG